MLFPFHVCLKGLEKKILFRDDEDYDVFVKMIFVCAHRLGLDIIIYGVVSNHGHVCLLACSIEEAELFGRRLKMMYSHYYHNKYRETSILKRVEVSAIAITDDRYLRNVLAYIPRNALDNGAPNVEQYRWTGYRGMFCGGKVKEPAIRVRDLTRREKERIMHTGDNLSEVPWLLDDKGGIEPASCCNWRFLEKAFHNDQAFFLRMLGSVNSSEMREKLVDAPRMMKTDSEFLKTATDICWQWFQKNPGELPMDKKARIIPILNRMVRTTVSQLARTFEIEREKVEYFLTGKRG